MVSTAYLLDTNVISELRKPRQHAGVVAFIRNLPLDDLYTSVVTLAELRAGIEALDDLDKRTPLHDWLNHQVRPLFDGRVLPISEDVMVRWHMLVRAGRKIGHMYSQPDLIIAATALHHGLALVTRNTSDYTRTGLTLVNPWDDAR